MLRGNAPAKLDQQGRLKVPATFRGYIEETHGRDLFVTSLGRDSVRIYPMPVWEKIEEKIDGLPSSDPALQRFLDVVNYYGLPATMDSQGRVLIHPPVREMLGGGEISVLGKRRWLEVWSRDLLRSRIAPITDDELRSLADLGL